jgi:thiol-disulfide isomerase/thioredoxin
MWIPKIWYVYCRYMNAVNILKADDLKNFIDLSNLIVVFIQPSCGSCKSIIPYLYKLDQKWNVVVVDSEKHMKSMEYYPLTEPSYYPSIMRFDKGKFKGVLTTDDIKEIKLY